MSLSGATAAGSQVDALTLFGGVSKGDCFRNARGKSEQMANQSLLRRPIFDLRDATLPTFEFQPTIFVSCLLLMTSCRMCWNLLFRLTHPPAPSLLREGEEEVVISDFIELGVCICRDYKNIFMSPMKWTSISLRLTGEPTQDDVPG